MIDEALVQKEFKTIRENLDLTQTKFGQRLGLTRQQIWNIEHGHTKLSKAQMLAIFYILISSPKGEDIFDYLYSKARKETEQC